MVKSFASVKKHNLWDFMNRKNTRSFNLKPSCLVFVYRRYKEERLFDKLHTGFRWRYFPLYQIESNQDIRNSNNGSEYKYYVI